MNNGKNSILIFTDWYYPGYRAGGPIQSCRNLINALGSGYTFYVFTSNSDFGVNQPYPDIKNGEWIRSVQQENVYYIQKEKISTRLIRTLVKEVKPDIAYFNSMFSFRFTILPLIALRNAGFRGRMILAPRGMLQAGALSFKTRKKKLFLSIFKVLGFHKRLMFHATDPQEGQDITAVFPGARVELAENIPVTTAGFPPTLEKPRGVLRLFFLSRLHPKKNLHFLLTAMAKEEWQGTIQLDIFGEAESSEYLQQCQQLAKALPDQITVRFLGGMPHSEMMQHISRYHALVLPTLGENFGHAIFESLISGVPVLISDQTPWRDLEKDQAGWDIPLDQPAKFLEKIGNLLAMDQAEHQQWREGARRKAEDFLQQADFENKYRKLFQ